MAPSSGKDKKKLCKLSKYPKSLPNLMCVYWWWCVCMCVCVRDMNSVLVKQDVAAGFVVT